MIRNKPYKRCFYYEQSREQRKHELERGLGLEGTRNYETAGCLTRCNGYDLKCDAYVAGEDLE